jgi:aspartate-semialdehyde dehydrogenase
MEELSRTARQHLAGELEEASVYPHPIAFDCLPQIDVFDADGNAREEVKMRDETRKIYGDPALEVLATCVRVPVFRAHSEAVVAEAARPVDLEQLRALFRKAPGVEFREAAPDYPMARQAAGRDPVFVGRLRGHASDPRVVSLWVVADNLRKGAALNAVQIAETVCGVAPRPQEVRT